MRIGYGVGDGDTTIQTTRRRWLILLLAFLLGAALVLVATNTFTPAPAHAADVCPADGPDGGKKDGGGELKYPAGWVVCVKAGSDVVEVTAEGTDPDDPTLQELLRALRPPIKNEVSHHTVIFIPPNSPPEITEISAEASTGATIEVTAAFTDPDLPNDEHDCTFEWGDTSSDVVEDVTSPCSDSHSYAEPGAYDVTVTVEDAGGLTDSETIAITVFDVICETAETCEINFEGNVTGNLTCIIGICTTNVEGNEEGEPQILVDGDQYEIIVIVKNGPAPGQAVVLVDKTPDDEFDDFVELPACGQNGPPNCVHINRLKGNRTEYHVFFTEGEDPRFKFR